MNGDGRLTCREKQLIKELTLTIAEVNSANSEVREIVFRSLASYVEGIKVGMKFPTRVNVQEMSVKDSLSYYSVDNKSKYVFQELRIRSKHFKVYRNFKRRSNTTFLGFFLVGVIVCSVVNL